MTTSQRWETEEKLPKLQWWLIVANEGLWQGGRWDRRSSKKIFMDQNSSISRLLWWLHQSTHVIKWHTLYQCQFPGLKSYQSYVSRNHGRNSEGYVGPLCAIFATSSGSIIISKLKVFFFKAEGVSGIFRGTQGRVQPLLPRNKNQESNYVPRPSATSFLSLRRPPLCCSVHEAASQPCRTLSPSGNYWNPLQLSHTGKFISSLFDSIQNSQKNEINHPSLGQDSMPRPMADLSANANTFTSPSVRP